MIDREAIETELCERGGTCAILRDVDSIWCSRQCAKLAKRLGFDDSDVWELCIAASELITNVLKYAGQGTLTITPIEGPVPELELIVEDEGPGIQDINVAMKDGISEGVSIEQRPDPRTRRGLGSGLGAVHRLMDEVTIENRVPHGVKVTAIKRAGRHRKA